MHGQHATCNMEASEQTVNGKRCEIHCEISIKYLPSPLFHHSPLCHATGFSLPHCARCIKRALKLAYCTLFAVILIYLPLPTLSLAQLAVLFFCCTLLVADAAEPETKPADAKAEAAVTTTKLTPSVEEPKSKTEKRDSSDQTGEWEAVETLLCIPTLLCSFVPPGSVYVTKPAKETPFRSSYASPATAPAAAAAYREVAESDSVFEPTTVRYSSVPQVSSNISSNTEHN